MDLGWGELDLSGMVRDELAQTPDTHGSPPHTAVGPHARQTVELSTHMDDVHEIPGGHRRGPPVILSVKDQGWALQKDDFLCVPQCGCSCRNQSRTAQNFGSF